MSIHFIDNADVVKLKLCRFADFFAPALYGSAD